MFNYVSVGRVAVFVLALTIYGVFAKGEETQENNDSTKEIISLEKNLQKSAAQESWVESLMWNLLGYATIIIPAAIVIRMLKNSNFNERSGKLFICTGQSEASTSPHPPPPPGHLNFWKISVQIPPSPSQIAVQMPPPQGNKPFYFI